MPVKKILFCLASHWFMPGNSANVKIETHCSTTDITQTWYIYYKNSLISTVWSRVWEHSEHFERVWKDTSEHWFLARKRVLGKCWNGLTWHWIWRSSSLARPFLCPWALFCLPTVWWESFEPFRIRESIPSFSNDGKQLNFAMHLLTQVQVLFVKFLPFQAMGRRNWKQNWACFLGSRLHRSSQKHPSFSMFMGTLHGINGMVHMGLGRYACLGLQEERVVFSAKNLPKSERNLSSIHWDLSVHIYICRQLT